VGEIGLSKNESV